MELISVIERLDNSEQQAKGTIMSSLRIAIIIVLATALAFVFACGGSGESGYYDYSGAPGDLGAPGRAGAPGQPGAPIIATVVVEKAVMVEKVVEVEAQEAMMMAPAAAAAPTAAPMAMKMSDDQSAQNVDISFQPQNRIIVRNADMSVESNDPIATIDDIGDLAISRGGWVVNSNTSDHGFYNITIRIPADTLDDVIEQITVNVAKVISVNSDSTDFTEEYIDLGARRSTIQETVDALTELLRNENYDSVQELLEVQREITNWQAELERIDGRLAFISESAAYSRLSVNVNRSPIPMRVDVGEDVHVGIGLGRKYTARFFPPEDYDNFEITWDFGDGSAPQTVYTGLRTEGEDGLLSVPVPHTYHSDEFAPHVVTVSIRAYSDRGLAEGEDQLWANVSELPRIDAFVTASQWDVEEGQPVTLTASFNHPDLLRNVRYSWDFRDGSTVVEGTVASGDTGVEIEHIFDRHRPESYQIVFEIRGDSDAGEVEETHYAHVYVYPGPEIESSDFNPGGTATNAVNALIGVASFAGNAGIWLAITSPIWLILGAIVFFIVRFIIRRQRNVQRVVYVPTQPDDDQEGDERTESTASA
ncbi:MAG: DUF4349 domain-containing protein [Chloroflexi bacterium]|nr:DUF4349 domain-containing protein [Chloroflexota bacterium]